MRTNKKIKETLKLISREAIQYANDLDETEKKRYLKKYLKLWEKLTDNEKLLIMSHIFELIHYKEVFTDPELVLMRHNIFIRTVFFTGLIIVILISVLVGLIVSLVTVDFTDIIGRFFTIITKYVL